MSLAISSNLLTTVACAQVAGTGSTLAKDLIVDWAVQFGSTVGGVTYAPTGSSIGVKSVREGTADFGVSDVPLTPQALKQFQLKQVPLAATGVAIFVNLPEFTGRKLRLNGDVLAEIYKGNIREWNHAQIQALNRGIALPGTLIVPIWRNDGSGQSVVFSTYLSRHSASWRRSPGVESRLILTAGKGVTGGSSVVNAVKNTIGAIGYDAIGAVRLAGGTTVAELLNSANGYVEPTDATIGEALKSAVWSEQANSADLDGSAGKTSYPMSTLTYALVPQTPGKGKNSALPFVVAGIAQGDAAAAKNGFVPLSESGKLLVAKSTK